MHPFFVYGTLLLGQPNFTLWAEAISSVQPATLERGVLYDMGSYPMLIERENGNVIGALVTLAPERYATMLTKLDSLENFRPDQPETSMYLRVRRQVMVEDGGSKTAWVYIGKEKFVQGLESFGGDWDRYSA